IRAHPRCPLFPYTTLFRSGVVAAVSGFAGGSTTDPTYEQVVGGRTGHLEAVRVTFDPARISYRRLVDRFWRTIDPTDPDGQFCRSEEHTSELQSRENLVCR